MMRLTLELHPSPLPPVPADGSGRILVLDPSMNASEAYVDYRGEWVGPPTGCRFFWWCWLERPEPAAMTKEGEG